MSAIAGRRKRRTLIALCAGLTVALLIPVLGVAGYRAIRDSKASREVVEIVTVPIPLTPTALVAITGNDGDLASIAVLTLSPTGRGGNIISVPVNGTVGGLTQDVVSESISSRFDAADLTNFELDAQSVLNLNFGIVAVLDAGEVAGLLDPLGRVSTDLPYDVVDGRTTLLTAGPQNLTPEQVALTLTAVPAAASEADRLPLVKTAWESVARAIGSGLSSATPAATDANGRVIRPADIDSFVSALMSGPVTPWQLQYKLLEGPRNPDNLDLLNLDRAEVLLVGSSMAPSAVTAPNLGLSYEIDSSFGDSIITKQLIGVLTYTGGNVLLTREVPGEPPQRTTVYYVYDLDRQNAEVLRPILGDFDTVATNERVDGIDIRIVLGEDFRTLLESGNGVVPLPGTTTTIDEGS